ncbi:MAG: DNA polymerase III [Methanophagales archaeon]|nr:AAA family ATPase [Methanophagales archaeon]MCU4139585.1 DNA polymerase III [Methanophagales archaeon]
MEEKRGTRETTPPRNNATFASATAWTEKYRPRTLREVVGNPKAVHELRAFADAFEAKKVKAVILYGPPGCGKTSAALALAAEKGWDVVELNASDKRSAEALKRIAGHASESETFTKQRRLIILDEADNIHGSEDRGGAKALYEILKRSEQPIILIANELHKINKRLREQCKIIPFRRLSENAIFNVLRRISAAERLNIDENTLRDNRKKCERRPQIRNKRPSSNRILRFSRSSDTGYRRDNLQRFGQNISWKRRRDRLLFAFEP